MALKYAHYIDAEPSPLGTRFCSACSRHQQSHHGKWKVSLNGRNRRWICQDCMNRRVEVKPIK